MKVKRLKEIWKDVSGYEGYYQVSNLGRVRGLDREVVYKDGRKRLLRRTILRFGKVTGGYLTVVLSKEGKQKPFRVARLVLETFVGFCPEGMEACHKNGIRTDNVIYNLRWDTPTNNQADKKRHGTNPSGERNGLAKLTEKDVAKIRLEYSKGGILQKELGRKFCVSTQRISLIIRGEAWSHI